MEKYASKSIGLKEIAPDFPYSCRYRVCSGGLRDSVARRGVVQPLLVEKSGDRYRIISGHRRFQAALEAGLECVPALVLLNPVSAEDAYILSVLSNWNQNFEELDAAFAVSKAGKSGIGEEVIVSEILPALGLAPEKRFLEEFEAVMTFPAAVLEMISEERIPYRAARSLNLLSRADQEIFARKMAPFVSFSSNQLMKMCEWLADLLKARRQDLGVFLETEKLSVLIADSKQDARQKADRFLEALRRLRFPELSRREKEFLSLKRAVEDNPKEPAGFSVEAPPYFEGEGIVLRAQLRDRQALEAVVKALEKKRKLLDGFFDVVL